MATMLVFVLVDQIGAQVRLDVLPEGFTIGEPIPDGRAFEFIGTVTSKYDWTLDESAIQEIGKLGKLGNGDGDYLVVTSKGSTVLVRVASSVVYHEEDIERPEPPPVAPALEAV